MSPSLLLAGRQFMLAAVVLGLPVTMAEVRAADPPMAGEKKLEDSLDSDLFDDLKPAKPTKPVEPKAADPVAKPGDPRPEPKQPSELDRSLDADLAGDELEKAAEKNQLLVIGERMKAVQKQLASKDASETTVARQQEIVAELDKLIEEMAKKQCKPCSNPSASSKPSSSQQPKPGQPMGNKPAGDPGPRGDKPATDSRDDVEKGKNEQADVLAAQKARLLKAWGHLPTKLREQLMNASLDEFLPAYERLIEDYYKRLAEDGAEKP